MKRKRRALGRKNKRMGMLLCVPAMVIVAFALYTLLYALVMSFNTNMGVVQGHFEFAGFDNYIETLKSKEMRSVIGNTLLYAAATILVELGIGSPCIRRFKKKCKRKRNCQGLHYPAHDDGLHCIRNNLEMDVYR